MEIQDYDKMYSEIRENFIIELNSELADDLYDANDEEYVTERFMSKYHKEFIHYAAFIFNNGRRVDLFKTDLFNKFEDLFRRINDNPMSIFIDKILPEIKKKYKTIQYIPLKKNEYPLFDYTFFNDLNNISTIEYIAKHSALQKILTPSKNYETGLDGIENSLNKLSQTQKALFFVYIREAGCISSFEEYGTGKLNGMQNLLSKYNFEGSFDAFKNKYNSFEKREKRLNKLKKNDLKAVIPLLIACPKAFDQAKKELEYVEQYS